MSTHLEHHSVSQLHCTGGTRKLVDRGDQGAYVVQGGTVLSSLDDLNGGILPHDGGIVGRKRHLGHADAAIVPFIVRARDAEHGLHDQGVVQGRSAVAQVDVDQGLRMAAEPARLEADGAPFHRPLSAIS